MQPREEHHGHEQCGGTHAEEHQPLRRHIILRMLKHGVAGTPHNGIDQHHHTGDRLGYDNAFLLWLRNLHVFYAVAHFAHGDLRFLPLRRIFHVPLYAPAEKRHTDRHSALEAWPSTQLSAMVMASSRVTLAAL